MKQVKEVRPLARWYESNSGTMLKINNLHARLTDGREILRGIDLSVNAGEDLLQRAVNVGFSGGEKKRNEVFQMAMLEPRLAILDETDSGLDIDALKMVARGVNQQRASDRAIVMITHYQRLLDYVEPDRVHVLQGGRIVQSGDKSLALELERRGYGVVEDAA